MNGAKPGEPFNAQYGGAVGDLKLLQLVYFAEAKGYDVKAIEVGFRNLAPGNYEGDIDLIATKGNKLLIFFESKYGVNIGSDFLISKTAPKYNAVLQSNLLTPYLGGLDSGYRKSVILYIPQALHGIKKDKIQVLTDALLENFDEWKFLRDIESLQDDTI